MDERAEVTVIRSRRRTFALQLKEDGFVLKVPVLAGKKQILAFLKKNEAWMDRQLADRQEKERCLAKAGKLSGTEKEMIRKKAGKLIPERVAYYAPLIGVDYGRIGIRFQKTRWGSCSAKGNLSFNALLAEAPLPVLDSVVVHELCHRKVMNHSSRFYAEVLKVFPEYRKWHRWLKEEGEFWLMRLP